ncbi:hypothetical protein [Moritella viscosa]|uniref:Lipoprotein n=1 Tax=Moritella viscosa TaxID=80854 RepID=A0ABY1HIZ2_9GAMM|nr:hypothetical protein [Moritella viscosa]SGY96156.1 Putative uncharacterized protein [Moritella viscosa]SGZ08649.1 Putative uncharacterized protein [Moritella viscosa]SHO10514.1 Putative uncharacterized protein [Moritella viscosa]SHO10515.1 Putative uncharacterized protein [Moritella viscosa]SHO15704.1 Putative uncharacterized protein [Moritella viscosa]
MKKKLLAIALGLSSSITLVGCGGGGGDDKNTGKVTTPAVTVPVTTAPTSVFYNVKVIDGYLKNAQVWLDINGDKKLDDDEPSIFSGSGGVAQLDVTNIINPEQYSSFAKIIFGQTVDEDTGPVANDYVMSAPPGEKEITPLSTLVSIGIAHSTDGTETAEEYAVIQQAVMTKIANALGIQEEDVFGDYIANGSGGSSYAAENIVISKILPNDTDEFITIIADNSDDTAFNKQVSVVSDMIKDVVEITAEEDFDTQVSIFDDDDDLDTDSDGDGLPDGLDALPNDVNEWLDSDGDLIGNNADPDDDNDGVIDELDIDPLDPALGISETKQVIQFLQGSSAFYTLSEELNNNVSELYIDGFTVNGDLAVTESYERIRTDNSLALLSTEMSSNLLLTLSGWTNVGGGYTLDLADGMLTAYPTDYSDISYQITSVMSELSGLNIAENSINWGMFIDDSTVYPEGAISALFSLKANQDTYSLSGEDLWVLRGNYGVGDGSDATTLNELITASSAGDNPDSGLVHGVSLGQHVGVELVADNTVNFYTFDFSETETAQKIASTTWSLTSLNGEEIISFTVPQVVIDSWIDRWEYDSPHIIFSVYQDRVIRGSVQKSGELIDGDKSAFMNEIAKNAVVGAVQVDITVCGSGDIDTDANLDDFEQAVSDCGGSSKPITSEMLIAQSFHRITAQGESRNHIFSDDGTVVVYEQGIESYTQNWSINGDSIQLSNTFGENGEESNNSIWVLLDSTDAAWSMKAYDTSTYRDGDDQLVTNSEVWSGLLDLRDADGAYNCEIRYNPGPASIDEFNAQLAVCGVLPEMDLADNSILRITGSLQTRSYVFNFDNTAFYYRNGVKYNRIWAINDDGNLELHNGEEQPLNYIMRLVDDSNGNLKFAVYDNGRQSIWSTTYKAVDLSVDILACEYLDSEWDDAPRIYRSFDEFKQAVTFCQDGKLLAAFSDGLIDRGITLTTGDALNQADDVDTYQFNQDGSGVFTYNNGAGDVSVPMIWVIHEEGIIKVVMEYTDGNDVAQIAHDYLAIVETNGIDFSVKVFSRGSMLQGIDDTDLGELESRILKVPDVE